MIEQALALFGVTQASQAVTKLIETVAAGCGVLYEPTRIRRKAFAEAEATIIEANANVEAREIEYRALARLEELEIRRQRNIENIARQGIEHLSDEVDPQKVDIDWSVNFFQHCQDVGNEQMQIIWGKMLAGEVARPGSFSPQTLHTVKMMRQADAELFTSFCSHIWLVDEAPTVVLDIPHVMPGLSFHSGRDDYAGAPFYAQVKLTSLGLIVPRPDGIVCNLAEADRLLQNLPADFPNRDKLKGAVATLDYFDRSFVACIPSEKRPELPIGTVILSEAGDELWPIAGGVANYEYMESTLNKWKQHGITFFDVDRSGNPELGVPE